MPKHKLNPDRPYPEVLLGFEDELNAASWGDYQLPGGRWTRGLVNKQAILAAHHTALEAAKREVLERVQNTLLHNVYHKGGNTAQDIKRLIATELANLNAVTKGET